MVVYGGIILGGTTRVRVSGILLKNQILLEDNGRFVVVERLVARRTQISLWDCLRV